MYIKSVTIENVLSIESASVSFPETGLLLVDGWNYDTESANGAGKSAIFHALSWGLYGQYPRGVSITDFVRQNSRTTKVTVDVELSANRILRVERNRPKSFYAAVNDVEITESEYEKILPLDYEQFVVAQYFAQGLDTRFLDLNDSGRKDLILKLMRADGFAEARKKIDQELKTLNTEKNNIINNLSSLNGKISAFKESQIDVASIRREVEKLENSMDDVRSKMDKLLAIQPPNDVEKYSELIEKLNLKLREISSNHGKIKAYRQQLRDAENQPEPTDSCDGACPSCGVELDMVSGELIKHDHASFASKLKLHKQTQESKIALLTATIASLEADVGKEKTVLDTIVSLKKKIKDSMSEYDAAQSRLSELKSFYKEKDLEKKSLLSTLNQQDELRTKIKSVEESIDQHNKMLTVKSNEILKLEAASAVLSPTGAPAYVMDSVLQTLNDRIQEIIQLIWPNSSYELLSFKENKSGAVTSKMSDSLTIDGVKRPVGSLSGGERRCLSLSIDFAIAEIVSRYTGAQLNPLILDEPFDHLDTANRSRVIEFLKEMATKRCIVVIDHASEAKALFDQSLTIVKRNGVSTVS
jgi:DNA repair exonuclease SbcCD ATPase subunit